MMRRVAVAAATLALTAGLTACGSSSSGSGGSSSTPPAAATSGASGSSSGASGGSSDSAAAGSKAVKSATVVVKNFEFTPGDVTLAKGGTVTWKFEDNTAHNVAADNDKFKSKTMQTGSYKYTFNSAGTYDYICTIHQYMKGKITVQ